MGRMAYREPSLRTSVIPGGVANWRLNPGRVNYVLITAINGLTYFVCLEAVLTLKRLFHI
jgi:hypothetical protein